MHGKSKQSKEISFCFVSFSKISKIHIAQHLSNYASYDYFNQFQLHAYETYMYAVVGGMAAMTQKRVMKLEKKKEI